MAEHATYDFVLLADQIHAADSLAGTHPTPRHEQRKQTLRRTISEQWEVESETAQDHHPATAEVMIATRMRAQARAARRAEVADSLRTADSLERLALRHKELATAYPFRVYATRDSLEGRFATSERPPREATAAELFGTTATLASQHPFGGNRQQPLTADALFQGFLLALAATFAMLMYHNMDDVRMLFSRISREATGKRMFEDPAGSGFSRFLLTMNVIGILFTSVFAVKFTDPATQFAFFGLLGKGSVMALALTASAAVAATALMQRFTLQFIGAVTLSGSMMTQLLLLRRSYFALGVILVTPFVLLYALCPPYTGTGWLLVIVVELAITTLLYLREAINLFLSKKISILHWFLYLCAIEIFPISLAWLLVVK